MLTYKTLKLGVGFSVNSKRHRWFVSALVVIACFVSAVATLAANYKLDGVYSHYTVDNKSGKEVSSGIDVNFTFLSEGVKWKLSATNSRSASYWQELLYDGTNMRTSTRYEGHFVEPRSDTNLIFTTISPSPLYLAAVDDRLCAFVPWVGFALKPEIVPPSERGLRGIPLPWRIPRISPTAFGYDWQMSSSNGILLECKIIRDSRLDLSDVEELRRPEFDYPYIYADYDQATNWLAMRKSIPDGVVDAEYKCTSMVISNGIAVPVEGIMKFYNYQIKKSRLSSVYRIKVNSIEFMDAKISEVSPPSSPLYLNDYRYRKAANERLFRFAEYGLMPGDSWKSGEDASLLALRDDYLRNGPKLGDFSATSPWALAIVKNKLAIILFVLFFIQVPVLVYLYKKGRKKHI